MKKFKFIIITVILNLLMSTQTVFAAQWQQDSTGWWYQNDDGNYSSNTWQEIDNKWYHFDANGYMQTGWIEDGGKWYYCWDDGSMAHDTWIGGTYYVGSDGVMYVNSTTPDGYYVGKDGVWDKNTEVIYNGKENKSNTPPKTSKTPSFKARMSSRTDPTCDFVYINFENTSASDIIVYGQGSWLADNDYDSFDRNLYLSIMTEDSLVKVKTITVKPGETAELLFEVIGEDTWYDEDTQVYFFFEYNGIGYIAHSSSKRSGCDSLAEMSNIIGTELTMDMVKLLPY